MSEAILKALMQLFALIIEIDEVEEALIYHNFSPRRPILENGQASLQSRKSEKQKLLNSDLELLYMCQILIVVLLFDDPGTYIELGIAIEKSMPTLVYDPYSKAKNLFLTEIPNFTSDDLDEIINQVFIISDGLINE